MCTMQIHELLCFILVWQATQNQAEIIKAEAPSFICTDGREIGLANVCDGTPHCADSSDETTKLCYHIVCPTTAFRCAYGACISRNRRCNGFMDCVDGSDELFCDNETDCTDQKFRCTTSLECIPFSRICDGIADCKDRSDENATFCKDYVCPEHTFQCSYGGCVHQEVFCDGIKDCIDGTDEIVDICNAVNCTNDDCHKNACSNNEFRCVTGEQCIPLNRVCDGTHQCRDASDERIDICKDRPCTDGQFRCAYGGCVPKSSRCNLKPDCHDWSDEDEAMCGTSLPRSVCRLPSAKPGTQYSVVGCKRCRPGEVVPELTRLDYGCHENIILEGPNTVYCQRGRWLPSLPTCTTGDDTIKCPKISSPGATKRCEVKWGPEAGWTSCDEALPIGTKAMMECREFYKREKGSSHITCLHDGTWSQTPLSCRPTCGFRTATPVALIVNGWNALPEEPLPWHATLFSLEKGSWNFFCGGTLIAERVVLTAAHCVWKTLPDTIKVLLASNSSNFTNQNEETQIRDVERVELQNSYNDHEGNYGSDLALLILKTPALINSQVLPACIDWSNKFSISQRNGDIGLIAGMGVTENDTNSSNLRYVSAKVIPEEVCRKKQTRAFRKYLTYTSFCAGWANGTGVCNGDSGGGFLLRRPNSQIWDIHGIVSLSPRRFGGSMCDPNYYTVFTKVSAYIDWIKTIVYSTPVSEVETSMNMLPNRDDVSIN